MGRDFFDSLPPEMIINILSRLPARTATICKCVCKPWLELLATPEFFKSYLSKAAPSLAVFNRRSKKPYRIVEFVDELDLSRDEHRWNVVFGFDLDLPFRTPVHSEANGLLFLCKDHRLLLCNPITRDYIVLPNPRETYYYEARVLVQSFGFGVSRMSGQYKLVRMFIETDDQVAPLDQFECQVYTVGTGSWRRITSGGSRLEYRENSIGASVNGNLHWLGSDVKSRTLRISCFDLETELFSTFSPPPLDYGLTTVRFKNLSVFQDCLCLCDNCGMTMSEYEIVIWLMKEYEDEKSWTMEYVIAKTHGIHYVGYAWPIKVFENGDILMKLESLLYYSNKTKTIRKVSVSARDSFAPYPCAAAFYTPSFLHLKSFAMENVGSYSD